MIKKYDQKLNLKSNIYKERSISPISARGKERLRQLQQKMKTNPSSQTKIFHNACCPNCKYLFKIPLKPTIFEQNEQFISEGKNGSKYAKKKLEIATISTQTDKQLLNPITSPKKQQFSKSKETTPKKTSKLNSQKSATKSKINSPNKSKNSYPSKSVYLIENEPKSQNQKKTDKDQQKLFKTSENYKNKAESESIPSLKTQRMQEQKTEKSKRSIEASPQKKMHKKELSIQQVSSMLQQIQMSSSLLKLLDEQPQTLQNSAYPSYYKLMLCQLENKKNRNKKYSLLEQATL